MSKTYKKKLRIGICYGNNTEFYRERRRRNRRVNRNILRTVLSRHEGEDVDDNLQMVEIHKRDSWNEPTDGTVLMDVDTINRNIINRNFDPSYMAFVRKHYRALKGFSKILGV